MSSFDREIMYYTTLSLIEVVSSNDYSVSRGWDLKNITFPFKAIFSLFYFFFLAFLVRLNSDCVGERKFKSVRRSFACGKPQLLLKPRHPKIKLFPRTGTESQPMSIIVSFFEAMSSLD